MVGAKVGSEHAAGSYNGFWIREQGRSDMSAYSKQLDLMNVKGLKKYTALHLFKERRLTADSGGEPTSRCIRSSFAYVLNVSESY